MSCSIKYPLFLVTPFVLLRMYASDIDFIEVEDKEEEDEAEEEEEAPIAVAPSVGVSVCCCCLRLPPFLEPSLLISVL